MFRKNKDFSKCPYYCECGECWLELDGKEPEPDKDGDKDGDGGSGEKIMAEMLPVTMTLLSVLLVQRFY